MGVALKPKKPGTTKKSGLNLRKMTAETVFVAGNDLIGSKKVGKLLKKFGYNGVVTAQACAEAMDAHGAAFAKPYGKMLQAATKKPQAKAKMLKAAKKAKASGQGGASNLTAEQKSEMGLKWMDQLGGLFGVVINNTDDIINAANGTNGQVALAQYEAEKRKEQEASQKTTLWMVLGGIGVLVLITIIVLIAARHH